MATILIHGGRVFDGTGFQFADIFIRDGFIEKIAPAIKEDASFIYDATGKLVTPGLIDIHMHMQGLSSSKWGTPADSGTLPFGVTAAVDASATFGDRQTMDAFGVKAMALVLSWIRDDHGVTAHLDGDIQRYGDRVAGVKLCFDNEGSDNIRTVTGLREICDFAHERGLPVTVHTTRTPRPMAELLAQLGKGDIATHVYHGEPNTSAADGFACLLDARKRGVILDAGLAGTGHVDLGILKDAIAAGAQPDTISTDLVKQIVYTRGGRFGLPMCMSICQSLGMAQEDVLKAVTINAAAAVGKADQLGILKEGGIADVAVFAMDEPFSLTDRRGNTAQGTDGYRCLLTVLDGNIAYRA